MIVKFAVEGRAWRLVVFDRFELVLEYFGTRGEFSTSSLVWVDWISCRSDIL